LLGAIVTDQLTENIEALLQGLSLSNINDQYKLIGVDGAQPILYTEGFEVQHKTISSQQQKQIVEFVKNNKICIDSLFLTTLHLLIQGVIGVEESVVGFHTDQSGSLALRIQYNYSDDDDDLQTLLEGIQKGQSDSTEVILTHESSLYEDIKKMPLVFYENLSPVFNDDDSNKLPTPLRPVRLKVAYDESQNNVAISFLVTNSISKHFDVDKFSNYFIKLLLLVIEEPNQPVEFFYTAISENSDDEDESTGLIKLKMTSLWAEVLNVSKESLNGTSDYFDVGGTSLNAFKLVNHIRKEFRQDLNIRDIVENSTINKMSGYIQSNIT